MSNSATTQARESALRLDLIAFNKHYPLDVIRKRSRYFGTENGEIGKNEQLAFQQLKDKFN
jgi:hypothetical protein